MSRARVLVVDDEAIVTMQLKERLAHMEYEVVRVAYSAEEALEAARQSRPDVILMDIVMPGDMDGIDVSGIIKSELDIPIIFLTAYADPKFIERARHVEPFGYIMKPFQEDEIRATIEIALHKKAVEQRLRESERDAKEFLGKMLAITEKQKKETGNNLLEEAEIMGISVKSSLKVAEARIRDNDIDDALESVAEAKSVAKETAEKLRDIAKTLSPAGLDIIGLPNTLRAHISDTIEQGDIIIYFDVDIEETIGDVAAIFLYRIAQETITNITKHAEAERIRVRLYTEGNKINLNISDDGNGFDMEKTLRKTTGLGVRGMRLSMESLGGTFVIKSAPNQGTDISAALPMQMEM